MLSAVLTPETLLPASYLDFPTCTTLRFNSVNLVPSFIPLWDLETRDADPTNSNAVGGPPLG